MDTNDAETKITLHSSLLPPSAFRRQPSADWPAPVSEPRICDARFTLHSYLPGRAGGQEGIDVRDFELQAPRHDRFCTFARVLEPESQIDTIAFRIDFSFGGVTLPGFI